MEFFLVSVLIGLIYGLLLFMVSSGLTLTFGMMGVLNFSHAAFYMLGAYFAYTISAYISFWVGVLFAPLIVACIGMFIERYILRPVHRYGHAHELLVTFGLVFIFDEFVKLFYGNYPVNYQVPDLLDFSAFSIFETSYPFYKILMRLVALLIFLGALFDPGAYANRNDRPGRRKVVTSGAGIRAQRNLDFHDDICGWGRTQNPGYPQVLPGLLKNLFNLMFIGHICTDKPYSRVHRRRSLTARNIQCNNSGAVLCESVCGSQSKPRSSTSH